MKKNIKYAPISVIITALVLIAGCASGPGEIEAGKTPAEYFQKAQQAVIDWNDYNTALAFYETVLEQYPNDLENGMIARYEIAFIHYKQNDFETAKEKFEEILADYQEENAQQLPPWPPVLAEKLLQKMEEAAP